ncbi:MAG: NAD(P)/FAD-dependent oxidoreductase [bacterium]
MVGGGPAGLATAIHAAEKGFSVKLFDRRTPPIDKACGEGLMPIGVDELERLGIPVSGPGTSTFQGVRYIDGDHTVEGKFQRGHGLGYRRTILHSNMVERAESNGVHCEWDTTVTGLDAHQIETSSGSVRARWIVGADGLHSRVRNWVELEQSTPSGRKRFGFCRRFEVTPWSRFVEVYWNDGAEAYVTPVGPKTVCVVITTSNQRSSFNELLKVFPKLSKRLPDTDHGTRPRGSGPMCQRTTGVVRDHVALVGDAAGYRDSITGEGLSLAFQQGRQLVEALEQRELGKYQTQWRRIARWPFLMTEFVLAIQRRPKLRRRIIRGLSSRPSLFSGLIELSQGRWFPRWRDLWDGGVVASGVITSLLEDSLKKIG